MLLLIPSAVAIAFYSVVIDAMMITASQPRGMTSTDRSVDLMYAAMIVTGVAGGALSQWGMHQTGFLVAGLSCGAISSPSGFLVRERRRPVDAPRGTHWPEAMWPAVVRNILRRMQSPRCGRHFGNQAS